MKKAVLVGYHKRFQFLNDWTKYNPHCIPNRSAQFAHPHTRHFMWELELVVLNNGERGEMMYESFNIAYLPQATCAMESSITVQCFS